MAMLSEPAFFYNARQSSRPFRWWAILSGIRKSIIYAQFIHSLGVLCNHRQNLQRDLASFQGLWHLPPTLLPPDLRNAIESWPMTRRQFKPNIVRQWVAIMKKTIISILAVMALVLGSAAPGLARGGHGHFGVGVVVSPGWGPWWGPYPYPYYSAPVVVEREPTLYLEPQAQEQHYWYFCNNPKGYYPYVKTCPDGWMKVVPTPTPTPTAPTAPLEPEEEE
jgi:hypothetical protein